MTVVTQIAESVSRFAGKCAVDDGTTSYTYAELWQLSGTVADHLSTILRGERTIVAVVCANSPDLLAIVLGCWRAGGLLLPFDPSHPDARLAAVLASARPAIVIADSPNALPYCPGAIRLATTDLIEEFTSGRQQRRALPVPAAADPAYVLYTSGSTGEPKGVVVSHLALASATGDFARVRPGLSSSDTVLSHTTLSFDISFMELISPLLAGAAISMAPSALGRRPNELLAWATDNGVTFVQGTPTLWQLLCTAGLSTAPGWKGIRGVAGGEALPVELATLLSEHLETLFNMYGPTETAIWSTCWELPQDLDRPPLLGGPLPHVMCYPLDPELRVAAIDSRAELYIGGDQLALGYLDAPRLTAERFVPDPFSPVPGARMYRSGDVVRVHADGGLEFLHRHDRQVKVHGQRIELGAVEAALLSHPEVEHAAITIADWPHDRVLVGCVVARTDLDPAQIRRHLAGLLPASWLPNTLAIVEALPLTASGKVDFAAVADQAKRYAKAGTSDIADSGLLTPLQESVLGCCREILGEAASSIDADFFTSGGDSLQAIRIVDMLNDVCDVELPLTAPFDFPILRDLAAEVEHARAS